MGVCTIHLLRHAEHAQFGMALTGRTPGVGLSSTGRRQAEALARRFSGVPGIQAVLTSPVQRARETADLIAAALGSAAVIDPGLDEIDFGGWAGQDFAALSTLPGWAAWNSARSLAPTAGGETMLTAQARGVATLMGRRVHGGALVAVSHADIVKAVLAYVLGMPLDLLHRIEVAPASRSVVVLGDDFARVEAVNLPP